MHYGHLAFRINKTGARFAMSGLLIESTWSCVLLILGVKQMKAIYG